MPYIEPNNLRAAMPDALRDSAAADTPGQAAAILIEICEAASTEVDGLLAGASPPPEATLKQAALWLAIDLLCVRRKIDFQRARELADQWRDHLRKLGWDGRLPRGPGRSTGVISEPARTTLPGGGLLI